MKFIHNTNYNGFLKTTAAALTVIILTTHFDFVQCNGFGRCPKYPSMPKFNMTKFFGTWYEVERSFYLPEIASGCTTISFNLDSTTKSSNFIENMVEVTVKTVNQWTGNPSVSVGQAKPETDRSSIMDFQFASRLPAVIARYLPGAGRYQVLFTNYDNFAILWSCSGLGSLGYTDQIWLLARERQDFPIEIRTKIYDSLQQLGLDPDRLVLSKNKNCTEIN